MILLINRHGDKHINRRQVDFDYSALASKVFNNNKASINLNLEQQINFLVVPLTVRLTASQRSGVDFSRFAVHLCVTLLTVSVCVSAYWASNCYIESVADTTVSKSVFPIQTLILRLGLLC